ncbi:MAG: hypothetical protein EA358_01210 [Flavobacteriales bacterium]|nr:MAG: hypothetical protein EA358_01210 [Flavobacteriales bacterium]
MNFPFRIIRLGYINKRCQLYTIVKETSELTEASKFIRNPKNAKSDDFDSLKTRLENIKTRHGARKSFFKPEGKDDGLVFALHAGKKVQGYLTLNDLRWYCIRLSERCVILGNGGIKHVGKTQEDVFLKEKEGDMRFVDRVIEMAQKNEELIEDSFGNLQGDLNFSAERIENYGF